ncbi:type II toxin-antitoxin system VapB family antitoxin [Mangrovibrevibacter kandeliae]|uniref:type II toxin-antitoxin system VapB family antitoxin n=1 Tax=Mangrovibrevibacter kandeliae TaxID=2968473 RepID=UPI002117A0E9|nr:MULTISPECIES: type II toxin-antitoxin system VapB family antitoxin [unclassified Aurantimonas]MCQ8782364.1 type II toxin-antitoxin system VapB family antitoxin [Aurantimonas sp. CSK15Z-1]MCW4114989.1 type II toxin-antitoxin system VapB family antitoxin [Aurantimonas sp. MSK8Z-1]
MPFHIKNPETDALARKVAEIKKVGLTEAVHLALEHELEREKAKPSLADLAAEFCRDLQARARPERA